MCNLYRLTTNIEAMRRLFGPFEGDRSNLPEYPEIFPGYKAPVLRTNEAGAMMLDHIPWGVPPPAAVSRPVTNVRNLSSPFWRSMLARPEWHCLVPVTSFCEWTGEKGKKQKIWFDLPGEELFAFAGLWRPTDDGPKMAFLTCEANAIVGQYHPKAMPVILTGDSLAAWLSADYESSVQLARPFPDEAMRAEPEAPKPPPPEQGALL